MTTNLHPSHNPRRRTPPIMYLALIVGLGLIALAVYNSTVRADGVSEENRRVSECAAEEIHYGRAVSEKCR